MALLTKTYWKWDAAHNESLYAINSSFPEVIPETDFELIDKKGTAVRLKSQTQKNVSILVDNNRIVRKTYQGAGLVEKLNIEKNFQDKVEAALSPILTPCVEEDPGEKLVLCYVDGLLATVVLTV